MPKKSQQPWVRPRLGKNNATANVLTTNPKIIENQRKLDTLVGDAGNKIDAFNGGTALLSSTFANDIATNNIYPIDVVNSNFVTQNKNVVAAVNELSARIVSPWIVGEYKWVKIGTVMPAGWTKVGLSEGETLISGTAEGTTSGSVISHNHEMGRISLENNDVTWPEAGQWLGMGALRNADADGSSGHYAATFTNSSHGAHSWTLDLSQKYTVSYGSKLNIAAGKYAELWVYTG